MYPGEDLGSRGWATRHVSQSPLIHQLKDLEVFRDRMGLAVARSHPFARRKRIRIEELAGEPVLLQPRRFYPRLHDDLIARMRAHGVVLDVVDEVLDGEALFTLVAIGDAVSFAAERKLKQHLAGSLAETVEWRPVVNLDVDETETVLWRPEDDGSPLVSAFLAAARQMKADLQKAPGSRRRRRR